MHILLSSFFLALLMLTYLYFFLLFLPLFDFDLDIVCSHPAFFLWVLCSSVSDSAATRSAYYIQGASLRVRHTPPATIAQEGKVV